jgi:hypothetical protein
MTSYVLDDITTNTELNLRVSPEQLENDLTQLHSTIRRVTFENDLIGYL